jgi:hypothetical protein
MPTIHYQHDDEKLCRSYLANVRYSRDSDKVHVESVHVTAVQLWCPGKQGVRVSVDSRSKEWEVFRITASWQLLEALRNDEAFAMAATKPGVLLMKVPKPVDDGFGEQAFNERLVFGNGWNVE